MISFLSLSSYGANSGACVRDIKFDSIRKAAVKKIFKRLFIDEFGNDSLPQIAQNYKIAASKALEHMFFLENAQVNTSDKYLELKLETFRDLLCSSSLWQNIFLMWFSHFEKEERFFKVAKPLVEQSFEVTAAILLSFRKKRSCKQVKYF